MTPGLLLVTADPDVRELVERAAAVAGVPARVVAAPAEGRRAWAGAAVVLVDVALLGELTAASLPPRRDVLLVTAGDVAPQVWRAALDVGADGVVVLPDDESALVARLTPAPTVGRARVIGVVGGSGGAGASVLAVALALAASRRGDAAALVEADPDGAGLDLALAAEELPGARWPELDGVAGPVEPEAVRSALPLVDGVRLLSSARLDDATAAAPELPLGAAPYVVDALASSGGTVVLDLPRSRSEVLDLLVPRCDVVLLVSTPDVRGMASSRRVRTALGPRCDLRLVLRDVPGAELGIDDVADWLGLPPAAQLAHDPRLTAALDRGEPPGSRRRSPLARTCDALLATLDGAP